MLMIVTYMIKYLRSCNLRCSIEMSWDYLVHVCRGPLSFTVLNLEVSR